MVLVTHFCCLGDWAAERQMRFSISKEDTVMQIGSKSAHFTNALERFMAESKRDLKKMDS